MHYRRSAEKSHQNRSLGLGMASDFTLGFLIAPTRGSNYSRGTTGLEEGDVPHRPYEGQQQDLLDQYALLELVPHRPYEGQQPGPQRRHSRPDEFLIAPTRGSNRPTAPKGRSSPGSSSPLRGAATCRPARCVRRCPGSSSPLRGAATRRAPGRRHPPQSFLIAPTRGSNRVSCATGAGHRQFLIAPTRGSNVMRSHIRLRMEKFLIAPTRGSNQVRGCPQDLPSHVPHRPYEGQQLGVVDLVGVVVLFLIAPTRGSNWSTARPVSGLPWFLIAPTRGSNSAVAWLRDWVRGSSSPLRGAATRPPPRRLLGADRFLIAPTRGSNSTSSPP